MKQNKRAHVSSRILLRKSRSRLPICDIKTPANLIQLAEPLAPSLLPAAEPVDLSQIREWTPYDGNTAFLLYIREIGKTKLLTPEEEIQLAKRVRKGDRKAREQMIKANLRLVVKIARSYEDYGMPLLDLINEGNIGLIKAVERFNPKKGAKLSTYSAWWIKQGIKRALANQSKTIRLPVHVVDKLFRMRQVAVRLQELLGREPTEQELGDELGMKASKITRLREASVRPASLDAPLGEDAEGDRIADVVKDENTCTPYEELEKTTKTNMVHELLDNLEPREAEILRHRFGLNGNSERTLDDIGNDFGLTRERIRQIQEIALKKLRRQIEKLETIQVAA